MEMTEIIIVIIRAILSITCNDGTRNIFYFHKFTSENISLH